MDYEWLFLKSLALTIFIETLVMVLYFRFIDCNKEIKISRLLLTGFIASFATLPYLWFIFPYFVHQKTGYAIVCESFAVFAEAIIIEAILRTKFLKSLLCSFACNTTSFLIGLIIQWA